MFESEVEGNPDESYELNVNATQQIFTSQITRETHTKLTSQTTNENQYRGIRVTFDVKPK